MNHAFHPEARLEFLDAGEFYEAARPGLGAAFAREIEKLIEEISAAPTRWRIFEGDVRRGFARRFPYAIIYTIEPAYVLIIAVAHCSREPGYWKHRLI